MIDRRPSLATTHASAFTVAEVLVSVGVLGLLLALSVPAVQSAREASRRQQCTNNLRQMGIALQQHEAVRRRYPRGGEMVADGTGGGAARQHAPHLYLLPFLDQETLYNSIDRTIESWRSMLVLPGYNDANETARHTVLPVFLCPSDPSSYPERRNNYRANVGITATPRETGVPANTPGVPRAGAFQPMNTFLRPQHFPDGLSSTVGFSEKLAGDGTSMFYTRHAEPIDLFFYTDVNALEDHPDRDRLFVKWCRSIADENPWHESTIGKFWFHANFYDSWYNHLLTPNHPIPDCKSGRSAGVFTARSAHPGGVNCLMMDGSVHFVADGIDTTVWQALGTRNGAEPVALP